MREVGGSQGRPYKCRDYYNALVLSSQGQRANKAGNRFNIDIRWDEENQTEI